MGIGPQGIHTGGFGVKLRPVDLLNFGQLFLQTGYGRIRRSSPAVGLRVRYSQSCTQSLPPRRYGWHWWTDALTCSSAAGESSLVDYYYARGYAGQFIYVVPELQLVTVLTQDNKRGKNNPPVDVFRDYIVPVLGSI